MRDHTEKKPEINEAKKQTPASAKSREQERPRYDTETEEPQICRGID